METVTIVVPAYNEAGNVARLVEEIDLAAAALAGVRIGILFVDDGSRDETLAAIRTCAPRTVTVGYVKLARNCGHQAALLAGLQAATGDVVITMDADLQHPPAEIPRMIATRRQGYDVVQMVRRNRQAQSGKRFLSWAFYRVMNRICRADLIPDASDFRLLTRRVVDQLLRVPERNKFLRGLIPMLGFRQTTLQFDEHPRHAGKPGYTFGKSLKLGMEALFSFSYVPLQLIFVCGLGVAFGSFLFGIGHIVYKLVHKQGITPGFTDIIVSILFLSGCTLLSLGVIGRYLMLILDQVRGRPEFIIEEIVETAAGRRADPLE
jgi:glycosyltransferase involved in cell wall biosynthesis